MSSPVADHDAEAGKATTPDQEPSTHDRISKVKESVDQTGTDAPERTPSGQVGSKWDPDTYESCSRYH